ncbi:MAG: phosphotransferase [Planktotalea sp.]|uniref:phosphotransferase enzyme family protein n=1 Tax=Planktotalea sp. TaxID=2029877 RepID=UPI0026377B1A|nr:phosphotransferase [Planktotalea sp.]MDG1085954.1 phosphotransferase [Planktotalea sp.]
MSAIVDKALQLWGLSDACYTLVAARENAVYKVTTPSKTYALRLHRRDYHTDAELASELQWMNAIRIGGLSVPSPIHSTSGAVIQVIDGVQVDVLDWLSGETLDVVLEQSKPVKRAALFHMLGQNMAWFHNICDAWQQPDGFTRCAWDSEGLLGDAPLWDRFWENSGLSLEDRALLATFRQKAREELTTRKNELDHGLIHADFVAVNVMVSETGLHFIDFDDGGFGYRVFELATALLKHIDAPDFTDLKQALINGYTKIHPIDFGTFDLFMALRATTYVGWNITRMDEDGGTTRNTRFIKTATKLAANYIG